MSAPRLLVANPSADLYGSDRMMLEAVTGFVEAGWEVVVTCSQTGPLVDELLTVGAAVRVLPVPVVRRAMMSPRGLLALTVEVVRSVLPMRRLLRDVRPQAVLVNTVTIPVWLAIARAGGVPTVVHVHEAERSGPRWARWALNAPLRLARRVVFNSAVSRGVAGLEGPARRGRVDVIHNGVRGPSAPTAPRAELAPPVQLVAVGRLSPRKGTDLAIAATALLRQRGLATELSVVGDVFEGYEWYEQQLRDQVDAAGLAQAVRFHGFRASVWASLDAADIAIVASRLDESFGNTLVEALLAGRPVVAADHTGLREAGGGFGAVRLVPADDATAIADAIAELISTWPSVRDAVAADAVEARRRFGVERFRRSMIDAVEGVSRRR